MPKQDHKNLEDSFKKITASFTNLSNVLINFNKDLEKTLNNINFGGLSSNLKDAFEKTLSDVDISNKLGKNIEKTLNEVDISDKLGKNVEKTLTNAFGKNSKGMKRVESGLSNAIESSAKKLGSGSMSKVISEQIKEGFKTGFAEVGKMASKLGLGEVFDAIQGFMSDIFKGDFVSGVIGIIGKSMNFLLDKIISIDKIAENISKHTGIDFNKSFDKTYDSFTKIQTNLKDFGVSVEDVGNSFLGISDSFAKMEIDDQFLQDVSLLAAKTGLTGQEAAEAVSSFQSISGSTSESAMRMIGMTTNLAKSSKTPLKMVINDIAKNSGVMAKYSGQFLENNIRAAISARKLGLSIADIAKSADGLLNIEESVAAQFEASVLLGRDINLDAARYYSLMGNLEGVQQEILKAVGGEAEFTAMLPLQRQALAKALGMNEDQLGKIISRKQEEIDAEEEMNKSIESARKSAMQLYNALGGDKLVGNITEIKTILDSIGNNILKIFFKSNNVKTVFKDVKDFLNKINEDLGNKDSGIYKAVEGVRDFIKAFFVDGAFKQIISFVGALVTGLGWILSHKFLLVSAITSIFVGKMFKKNSIQELVEILKAKNKPGAGGIGGIGGCCCAPGGLPISRNNDFGFTLPTKDQKPSLPNTKTPGKFKNFFGKVLGKIPWLAAAIGLPLAGSLSSGGVIDNATPSTATKVPQKNPTNIFGRITNSISGGINAIPEAMKHIKANGKQIFKNFLKAGAVGTALSALLIGSDISAIMDTPGISNKEKDKALSKLVMTHLGGILTGAGIAAITSIFSFGGATFVAPLLYFFGSMLGSWLGGKLADAIGAEFIGKTIRETFFEKQQKIDDGIVKFPKGSLKFNNDDNFLFAGTNLSGTNSNNSDAIFLLQQINSYLKIIVERDKQIPEIIVNNKSSNTNIELSYFDRNVLNKNVSLKGDPYNLKLSNI